MIEHRLTYRQRRNRAIIGASYFALGVATIWVVLALKHDALYRLDWPSWFLFTLTFVVLGVRSVEVNDRLVSSSSVMPIFTGGVVFALQSGDATVAMMLMGASGLFGPGDIRNRRVFQPATNFGQMTVLATVAGLVLDRLLGGYALGTVSESSMPRIAFAGTVAAFVGTVVNLSLVRVAIRAAYGVENLVPWSRMSSLFFAQLVMGFLGGMLGALLLASTPASGDTPAGSPLVPLVLGVFVLGHFVYTSYSQLRQAHEDSLKGFVKTLETRDLYTRGHTERVAEFCHLIGEELGFTGTQLERMRWAALIHDMGKLAVPAEVLNKQGTLTDEEYRRLRHQTHLVDDLLSGVDFLRPMVEITSGSHPRLGEESFGQTHHRHSSTPSLEQQVLAVADAFDAMTSSRTYRMSMSQTACLESLIQDECPLYDPDVVAALQRGIERTGKTFGQPLLGRWETTELAEAENA